MEEILKLIEGYGLPLVLLEVKNQFSRHHEKAADNINEMIRKIDIILEFIKRNDK